MQPFRTVTGVAAPLLRDNVDTDAIIPSREIKAVSKQGLADGLFAGWRYRGASGREPDPDFVLCRPEYAGARILLAGANFGCGSSREHAVWALAEYGIRAILAPGFAPIFLENCLNNGVLALALPEATVRALAHAVAADPRRTPLTIDLEERRISGTSLGDLTFSMDESARRRLLDGMDAIDATLNRLTGLEAYERRDRLARPWAYPASSARAEPPA